MKAKQVNINGGLVYMIPRATPEMSLVPAPHLVNDGKSNMRSTSPGEFDTQRANRMSYLKPRWA